MSEFDLRFSSSSVAETGSFKLLELPPDLYKILEGAIEHASQPNLTIKGASDEDAVLCTTDKTYTVRSVVLSNKVLVVTRDPTDDPGDDPEADVAVAIRDQLGEILELVPSVPRLHKLNAFLKGREYDEGHEDEDSMSEDEGGKKKPRFTYEDARATIQASDAELDKGLRDRRILILKGELRPLAPSHLAAILELLLTNLVSLSLPHTAAPVSPLLAALEDDHDIRREVARQVMAWFGRIAHDGDGPEKWEMDVDTVVKEVGLGILRTYKNEPVAERPFLEQWKKAVGDTFEERVLLTLLSGNFLTSIEALSDPPVPLLTYFPCSALPVDPGARFAELFLVRPRWKAEEITPFLSDIAVDGKERDNLLLKHARAITEPGGVWYTARAKYNA
ncbi:sister chromatid cohesion protein Dcc1 [Trametes meyenii]|nr:sister chromatid cohesion protein Dcc1 [Trametes meyenii]